MMPIVARQRSPNYPTVPITTALDSARKFYAKAQRTTVHPEEAQRAMGYSKPSGASRSRLAALRQYGLLDDTKGGVRLTELGLRLLHPQSDEEYQQAVAEAALTPPLFKELWESHRSADPSIIASHLIRTRNFSTAGAKYAADAFKATVSIVKAPPEGYSSPDAGQRPDPGVIEQQIGSRGQVPPGPVRSVQVPLSATAWATVQAPFPISEEAWTQLLAVLNAMKPGLVASPPAPTSEGSEVTDLADALKRSVDRASAERTA